MRHPIGDTIGAVALLLLLLRSYSLLRAIIWIWNRGAAFRALALPLYDAGKLDDTRRSELFGECGGNYFPFGVKQNVLRRARGKTTSHSRRIALRCLQWSWQYFVFSTAFCVGIVLAVWERLNESAILSDDLVVIAAVILVVNCLFLVAEPAIVYVEIDTWGALYHGFSKSSRKAEYFPLFGAGLILLLSSTILYFVTSVTGRASYTDIASESSGGRLVESAYGAVRTVVLNGYPTAANLFAEGIVSLILVAGAVYLLVAVSLAIAAASRTPNVISPVRSDDSLDEPSLSDRSATGRSITVRRKLFAVTIVISIGIVKSLRRYRGR